MSMTSRVDKIMSWITDKKQPANLVLAYFEEPDNTSHFKGGMSQETRNQIVKADNTIKYIYKIFKIYL